MSRFQKMERAWLKALAALIGSMWCCTEGVKLEEPRYRVPMLGGK